MFDCYEYIYLCLFNHGLYSGCWSLKYNVAFSYYENNNNREKQMAHSPQSLLVYFLPGKRKRGSKAVLDTTDTTGLQGESIEFF